MASISAAGLYWATPDGRPVLRGVDLQLTREKAGLVGRNGVGKTTLLHILAGALQPTAGKVIRDGTVRLMRQQLRADAGASVADLFGARAALAVLRKAEAGKASLEELADADWTLEERIGAALALVGLDVDAATPLATLSGGQRTRAGLAAAAYAAPDFLLLDEPTNNLDRAGREALIRFARGWTAGLVVISHDRELLDTMDAIVELTTLGATRYGGNWSQYRARKAIELDAAAQDLAHAEKRRAEVARKTQIAGERKSRRDAAGARKAARGDMPRILAGARKNAAEASGGSNQRLGERLAADAGAAVAAAQARIEVLQRLSITLPSSGLHADRTVLALEGVAAGYAPQRPLFRDLHLTIVGPERVAITGPNGAGKSSLLKLVSGELSPLTGQVRLGVAAAMIDQEVAFLDRRATILENFRALNPGADENSCRAALAGFLFRAEAALQTVGTLSGGQMLRAGLACRLAGPHPPQLLILDEPTNHLDIESIEAVEAALQAYDGAMLVVSHDANFLQNIGIERSVRLDGAGAETVPDR